jgi:hypothetical protein
VAHDPRTPVLREVREDTTEVDRCPVPPGREGVRGTIGAGMMRGVRRLFAITAAVLAVAVLSPVAPASAATLTPDTTTARQYDVDSHAPYGWNNQVTVFPNQTYSAGGTIRYSGFDNGGTDTGTAIYLDYDNGKAAALRGLDHTDGFRSRFRVWCHRDLSDVQLTTETLELDSGTIGPDAGQNLGSISGGGEQVYFRNQKPAQGANGLAYETWLEIPGCNVVRWNWSLTYYGDNAGGNSTSGGTNFTWSGYVRGRTP